MIEHEEYSTTFTGEDVKIYAFLMLRSACRFRVKTGMSTLRMQEIKMAHNYGWSTKRTVMGVLADLERMSPEEARDGHNDA